MEETVKIKYESPSVEVTPIVLEGNIAVQSPIRSVDLDVEDWIDGGEIKPDTGDIFIAI